MLFQIQIFSCLDQDMTIFQDFQKVRDRDETLAWRDRDEAETLKNVFRNVFRDRDTSRDIQLYRFVRLECPMLTAYY